MNRRVLAGLLAAVAAAGTGWAVAGAQEEGELRLEAVDARAFPVVSVLVTPPPSLYGVTPESLSVQENGILRPASLRLLAQEPLEVLLVVDTSGSMRGAPLEGAKEAAAGFVQAVPPTTLTAIMGFSTGADLVAGFGEDPAPALAALATLEASGETALYDAVIAALEAFPAESRGRPFIVLLSDGGDTVSTSSLADARDRLAEAEIGFYAVELVTEESDRPALDALAEVTTGRVVSAGDPNALAEVYDQIASELSNQLVVTYETLRGGPVQLTITIEDEGVRAVGTSLFTLPGTTPITTTSVPQATTTIGIQQSTTTTLVALASYQGSGPGLFGSPWVLPAALAGFFLVVLTVFALALAPGGRPRSQLAGAERERFTASGGWLTRFADWSNWVAEAVLRRGGRRSSLTRALDSAGLRLGAGELVVLSASAGIVGMAVGVLLFGWLGALALGILGLAVPRFVVAILQQRRRQAFADELDGTVQLLAGSLRAGYGLLQSVATVSAEAPPPVNEEFSRIIVETRLGRDLVESLTALADRMDSRDFHWIAQAIDIQRSVGGDLAQILDTVSHTIRERNLIRRQVKALSAEGRASAYILIALPFLLAGLILVINPGFLAPLVETSAGKLAIGVGALLIVLGWLWIRRLIRLRF